MASLIYVDTHVVAWLFAGRIELIPALAQTTLNENQILISPAVVVELQYLYEVGRTAEPARPVVDALGHEIGLEICDLPFPRVAFAALDQTWTRDPFDRLIAGQALVRGTPLLTKDETIRRHCTRAFWKGRN